MFAITPYAAERDTSKGWQPCRVIGIAVDATSVSPSYVVEYHVDGIAYLKTEECVRKVGPGNPH